MDGKLKITDDSLFWVPGTNRDDNRDILSGSVRNEVILNLPLSTNISVEEIENGVEKRFGDAHQTG
jgi:hypothetical protein